VQHPTPSSVPLTMTQFSQIAVPPIGEGLNEGSREELQEYSNPRRVMDEYAAAASAVAAAQSAVAAAASALQAIAAAATVDAAAAIIAQATAAVTQALAAVAQAEAILAEIGDAIATTAANATAAGNSAALADLARQLAQDAAAAALASSLLLHDIPDIIGLVSALAGKADLVHTHDAAALISGTIDIARIPVLPSQVQIASPGLIANLTAPQQAQIGQGTVVTATDGWRWVYTGTGSKVLEASYIQLADITPEWSVIANKPALFDGAYGSLTGRPTLGTAAALNASVVGGALIVAADQAAARVAIGAGTSSFDGVYSSLSGKPTLFDGAYASLSGKPTLGTLSSQAASAVAITGGSINGTPIGQTTPAAGAFTALSATGKFSAGGATVLSRADGSFYYANRAFNLTSSNVLIATSDAQAADVGGGLGLGGAYDGTSDRIAFAYVTGRKSNSSSGDLDGYLSVDVSNAAGGVNRIAKFSNATGLAVTGAISTTVAGGQSLGISSSNVTGVYARFTTSAGTRGFIGTCDQIFGGGSVADFGISAAVGNLVLGGTNPIATISSTGLAIMGVLSASGAFGCNGQSAQGKYASGGTLAGMNAALIACGICST